MRAQDLTSMFFAAMKCEVGLEVNYTPPYCDETILNWCGNRYRVLYPKGTSFKRPACVVVTHVNAAELDSTYEAFTVTRSTKVFYHKAGSHAIQMARRSTQTTVR